MKERKSTSVTLKDENGVSHKKTISFRTKAELIEKTEAFRRQITAKKTVTVRELALEWKDKHEHEVEHYTADCYEAPLKDIISHFGEDPIEQVTAEQFQVFLDNMGKLGYAKQTIKLRKIVMNQIMDYAIYKRLMQYNPIRSCKIPKAAPQSRRELPTDEDIEAILSSDDCKARSFMMLLMYTGLRREEALALTPKDIDLERCCVSVNKVVIFDNGKPVVRNSTKSDSGVRFAPFPKILHELYEDVETDYLIGNELPTKSQFDKMISAYKEKNGISCTCHQLRHYFATTLYEMGADTLSMQRLMGHANYSTTAEIYTHIKKQQAENFIKSYNEKIEKASKQEGKIKSFPTKKNAKRTHLA